MTTETPFGLATFALRSGSACAGLAIGERVAAIDALLDGHASVQAGQLRGLSVLELLERWHEALPLLVALAGRVSPHDDAFHDFAVVKLLPPVNLPRQVFCTGANYRKHVVDLTLDMGVGPKGLDRDGLRKWAEEMMDERAATGLPYVFTKPVSTIAGARDVLAVPAYQEKPDWELELAVVIGRGGRGIGRDQALSHVAGYAIVNDVTSRSLIARTDYQSLGTDWFRAKGQPGYLPFGPVLVPAQFVVDPYALALKLTLNGETMQDESAADMIFDIARQIEYISTYATLLPGDVICTGSPAGNGTHYDRFLKPGDLMVGEIGGLGRQIVEITARD
jgi:2,4-diketo-3-deoxy-L-fuconate hydrolase